MDSNTLLPLVRDNPSVFFILLGIIVSLIGVSGKIPMIKRFSINTTIGKVFISILGSILFLTGIIEYIGIKKPKNLPLSEKIIGRYYGEVKNKQEVLNITTIFKKGNEGNFMGIYKINNVEKGNLLNFKKAGENQLEMDWKETNRPNPRNGKLTITFFDNYKKFTGHYEPCATEKMNCYWTGDNYF